VKLLDFGIAKLLEQGSASETHLTQLSGRALTPEYASPEQIQGEPLSVASDVYSLGVLLFELLTGQRPYKLKRDSRGALEDAIVQMEAPRASSVAQPRLQRFLRGDLDNILAKALRKQPDARYATVGEFAEDVARHLDLRPVLARPDSRWYRLRRFVARNSLGVGATGAVLVALIGGVAVAMTQRNAALAEKRRAEAVRDLVAGIFDIEAPNIEGGKPLPAVALLKKAASMVARSPSDDPLVRAEITRILAKGMLNVADMEGAAELALGARKAALAHYPADHREVVRARLLHCEVLRYRGALDEMRSELDAVLPVVEARSRQMPDLLFEAHYLYANMEIDTREFESATRAAQRAVAVAEEHFGHESPQYVDGVQTLASVDLRAGRPADGLRRAEEGLSLALRLPDADAFHKQVIAGKVVKAHALRASGQIALAASQLQEVTRDAAVVHGPDSLTVGFHLQNLVNLQLRLGRNLEALDSATRALRIFETFVEPGSFNEVAAQNGLAHALLATRRTADALDLYQRVLPTATRVFGRTHANTRDTRANIALAHALSGDVIKAGAEIDAVLKEQADMKEPGSSRSRLTAGIIRRLQARPAEAISLIEESLGADSTFRDDAERAAARVELALAREAAGHPDWSSQLIESLAVLEAQGHGGTPSAASARAALSRGHAGNGRRADAVNLAAQVEDFWKQYAPQSLEAREAARWRASLANP
jgi:eukaryotic-like serine/threonine-protein kinase